MMCDPSGAFVWSLDASERKPVAQRSCSLTSRARCSFYDDADIWPSKRGASDIGWCRAVA